MRLSLVIPFNISNYVLGASSVNIFHFVVGTLGVMPLVLFFVFLGTTMSDIEQIVSGTHKMETTEIVVMSVGSMIALGAIIFSTILVRKTLKIEI